MTDLPDMAERMRALRERFVVRAREDRVALAAAWDEGDRETVIRLCHSLAGNAGLFGFGEVGQTARALEDMLVDDDLPGDRGAAAAVLFERLDGLG